MCSIGAHVGADERGRPSGAATASPEFASGANECGRPTWFLLMTRLGLIAGNGKFPFLVLDAARAQGYEVVVAAIKEEAAPEIESQPCGFRSLGFSGRTVKTD